MINAKEEFIRLCKEKTPRCVTITLEYWCTEKGMVETPSINLKCYYTPEDMQEFLNKLDFEYDNGFGVQRLFGVVWFEDGTWATRGEYDGSEWWEVHEIPEIPDHLKIR